MLRSAWILGLLALAACGDPAPPALEIRAAGPDGGPRPWVLVTLMSPEGHPVAALYDERMALDADGRCRIEGLPEGPHSLRLSTLRQFREEGGYDEVAVAAVTLARGRIARADLRLAPGGRISLTLTDPAGVGVPARLVVETATGERVAATFWRSGEGGWTTEYLRLNPPFLSCVLPPGPYRVRAVRYRDEVASGEAEVAPGAATPLRLSVENR